MLGKILISFALVLFIFYVVAFVIYGSFSAVIGLKPPSGVTPTVFLLSVLVQKIGHSLAFVGIFYLARHTFAKRWILYALIWWTMFSLEEIGKGIGPAYTWYYVVAGIVSELMYFPLSAFVLKWLLRTSSLSQVHR